MTMATIIIMILMIFPSFVSAGEKTYNKVSIENIYDELSHCVPDSIKDKINIIDEMDFMRGFLHYTKTSSSNEEFIYQFFDCRKSIVEKININETSCQDIFPDKMCGNSYIDYLIYKGFYYHYLNYSFDMQHAVDSIMNELYSLDSISAYRSIADTLNETYIPKSLEEALIILEKELTAKEREEINTMAEEEFARKEHISLGMSIRNSWSLWGKSRFQRYLETLSNGIDHPDDQSTLLLILLHRKLNGKPLDKWNLFEEQKRLIKQHKEKLEKLKNK